MVSPGLLPNSSHPQCPRPEAPQDEGSAILAWVSPHAPPSHLLTLSLIKLGCKVMAFLVCGRSVTLLAANT